MTLTFGSIIQRVEGESENIKLSSNTARYLMTNFKTCYYDNTPTNDGLSISYDMSDSRFINLQF